MRKYLVVLLLLSITPLIQARTPKPQTKTVKVVSKTAVTVTRKDSVLHVLSNFPKALASGLRIVSDGGEYVSGKIYAGFQKFDAAVDEYVEGQTQ